MTRPDCVHDEGNDPRNIGRCVRCGADIPKAPTMLRSLQFEADMLHHAAKGVVDARHLIEHAQFRSSALSGAYVPDSMLVRLDIDQALEVMEEAADACNRTMWLLQAEPEHERRALREQALRHFVIGYELIRQSRQS